MAEHGSLTPRTLLLRTDRGIAAALREVLQVMGHEVHEAHSSEDATVALRRHGFSLLVADDALGDPLEQLSPLDLDRRLGILLLTSGHHGHHLAADLSRAAALRVATLGKPFGVAQFVRLAVALSAGSTAVPGPRPAAGAGRTPAAEAQVLPTAASVAQPWGDGVDHVGIAWPAAP